MKTIKKLSCVELFILFYLISFGTFAQTNSTVSKAYLDDKVCETSGLIYYNEKLWTHNDSGGEAKLFRLNPSTGEVIKEKVIVNARNRDWEDICIDDKYAYIGDIGNNSGKLSNFIIYRITLEDLDFEGVDSIYSEKIIFSYDEEYYLKPKKDKYNKTNFDCEAMISKGDSLYLFSKNWIDKKCYFYSIPKKPGTYIANFRDTLDTKGLICGADYNSATNTLAFIGYVYGIPAPSLLIILSGFEDDNFFKGNCTRKELDLRGCQTEGVVFVEDSILWISNEIFMGHKQELHEFALDSDSIGLFITENNGNPELVFCNKINGNYKIKIINSNTNVVKKIKNKKYSEDDHIIDTSILEPGTYNVIVYNSKISYRTIFEKQVTKLI